ncbi:MAG: TetR/AcrR family transcriptional regulator [Myxococcales bacterium]|nr:MAG: TetR/AcrR family transcriptional regulator [Myxococcales bacterium]
MSTEISSTKPLKKQGTSPRSRRRAEILDAAAEVFSKSGFHQTRIADIIESAGIARGTFYLYFESKGAVFLALLKELLERLRASVVGVDLGSDAPPIDQQLVQTVQRILNTVVRDRSLATIIVREAVSLDAEAREILNNFYGSLRHFIRESIRNGQSIGVIGNIDVEVSASCVLGTVKQVMEEYVMGDFKSDIDVERAARAIVAFNMHGLEPVV